MSQTVIPTRSSARGDAKNRDEWLRLLWRNINGLGDRRLNEQKAREGFEKIGNPLLESNLAIDSLISELFSGKKDGISFQDLDSFVHQSEINLWLHFQALDRDGDGQINVTDLTKTLADADICLSEERINKLHGRLDVDHDGVVSFQDWRDLLVFAPLKSTSRSCLVTYLTTLEQKPPSPHASESALPSSLDLSVGPSMSQGALQTIFGSVYLVLQSLLPPSSTSQLEPKYSSPDREVPINYRTSPPSDLSFAVVSMPNTSSSFQSALVDAPGSAAAEAFSRHSSFWASMKESAASCVPNPGYFVAGGVAGMVSRTTTAPLDRLKVYLIAQTARKPAPTIEYASFAQRMKGNFKPLADTIKELWAAGGMRSLFSGNGLNVVKIMPESAIKFGSYEATKTLLAQLQGLKDPMELSSAFRFLAGGISGIFAQAAVYPIDTLKFRMQCETVAGGLHGNRLIISTFMNMWKQNGLYAFYRGLPMGVIGMFPYAAIDLGTFDYLKRWMARRKAEKLGCSESEASLGSFNTALMGGFSGAIGACSVYPLNVLRTRLQSQGTTIHPRTYTGTWDVTVQTYRGEGFRGFYRGITPNLLKVVPAISITYVVYEKTKEMLHLH